MTTTFTQEQIDVREKLWAASQTRRSLTLTPAETSALWRSIVVEQDFIRFGHTPTDLRAHRESIATEEWVDRAEAEQREYERLVESGEIAPGSEGVERGD